MITICFRCPTYTNIPPVCQLVDQPGTCCKKLTCTNPGPSVTRPAGTTIVPSPAPVDDNCTDRIDNCRAYGQNACSATYKDWATRNCALYCGICRKFRLKLL